MTYYIDGYTKESNPSTEGGYTITDKDGKIILQSILKSLDGSKTITNNYTEFVGLCEAIKLAEPNSTIYTDSMNNLSWIDGGFPKKSKRKDLIPLAFEHHHIYKSKNITLSWCPREDNLAGHINEEMFSA